MRSRGRSLSKGASGHYVTPMDATGLAFDAAQNYYSSSWGTMLCPLRLQVTLCLVGCQDNPFRLSKREVVLHLIVVLN